MTMRAPVAKPRPPRRLQNALAVGAAFTNTGILYEVVTVFGSARVKVRAKVATANALLDLVFVGPDFDPDQVVAYGSLKGTLYTTGEPAEITLTAGTENQIYADVYGEGYVIVKLTGQGSGTITYVDVSQV